MDTRDALRTRAETEKLAAQLDVRADELGFLAALPADDVRILREQSVAALFDGAPDMLDRIARATRLVPAGVAAAISQKALGPRLAAAVAGRLEPARAADIIDRLPVAFTAVSCAHLDPRRIAGIVDRLDEGLLVRISVALAERGDHLTMGRFVGHLPDAALTRILPQVDDAVVLRTGYAMDQPQRLGRVIELMGEERLARVIASAADGLWPQALAIAGMAPPEQRARIATLTARRPAAQLDTLVHTVADQSLWESLLPLVALLSPEDRRTMARLPSLADPDTLDGIVPAVVATALWADFLPLAELLPDPSRQAIANAAATLADEELDALAREVAEQDLWDAVLPLVELMDDAAKERIFALPSFQNQA
ncbi:hypothetical protein [Streptomyces sp. NBC_00083]|uniref:hypothetical protein n=1 Tax=Streptomyces sp. NBC_00083 TaxID=2975647 RepID=UPI002253E951|nr:hypothetical protein [Streptomyces sp. NBC_00083]MCX5383025.1 hypothetical protein [Streptomyces sp. NBC_00083]